MNKNRTIIIVSSLFLCLSTAAVAAGLALFVPDVSWQKNLVVEILLILSLFPIIVGVLLLRNMTTFARYAEQYSTRDSLTSLYNQKMFWDFLRDEIERSRRQDYRFTVMIVDVDNFKAINDIYGHETGDAYLLEFSTIFKSVVRKGDIIARYSGDNFTAILPVCDESQAYIVAKRLLEILRDHFFLLPNGSTIQSTASIGMAVFPDHAKDSEGLFLVAETMLNQAKLSGKDRMRLPSDEVNIELLKSAGEKSIFIMEAIRKKQVVPYFQSIVDVKKNTVLAYEVLTRIVTPQKVYTAVDFIEAAEGMGAIGKIDYLLMEQAFDAVKRNGYRGKLFLNLSPKALVMNEFIPTLRSLMDKYGVEPSQMVFEITERDTVKNLSLIEKIVNGMRSDGFRFAIDDFGSGYSSFQYIKLFQVDFLKIDGEFVRNMTGNGGLENAIVKNIANLAMSLGIKTIAEYVESEAILENVRSSGIDYAQGYHIQRPAVEMVH